MPEQPKKYSKTELENDLTDANLMFCNCYVQEWNKTESYHKAYPDVTRESAAVLGHKLLKNVKIQQYIEYLKDNIAETVGISKIGLLNELKALATSDISDIYEGWFDLKELERLKEENPEVAKAIKSIQTKEDLVGGNQIKIEMHDKSKAIADIFKAMGWNTPEKIEVSQNTSLSVNLEDYSAEEKKLLLKLARKK